jgi:hypothetical protein
MEAEAADAGSYFILYLFGGVGNCVVMLLALYNVIALVGVMRSDDEGASSGLAKGAWGMGCLSVVFFPCAPILSIVAMILSRLEIGRVYRDESPLASATPARMGSVNGGVALLVFALWSVGVLATVLL